MQEKAHQKKKKEAEVGDRIDEVEKKSHAPSCTVRSDAMAWISGFYTLLPPSTVPPAVVDTSEEEEVGVTPGSTHERSSSLASSNASQPVLREAHPSDGVPPPVVLSYTGGCCLFRQSLSSTGSSPYAQSSEDEEAASVAASSHWLTPPPLLPLSSSVSSFPGVFDLLWLPPFMQTRFLPVRSITVSPPRARLQCREGPRDGPKDVLSIGPWTSFSASPPCLLAACTDGTVRVLPVPPHGADVWREGDGPQIGKVHSNAAWSSASCGLPDAGIVLVGDSPHLSPLSCTPQGETDPSDTTAPLPQIMEAKASPKMLTSATPFFFSFFPSSSSSSMGKEEAQPQQCGYVLTTAHEGGCRVHSVPNRPLLSCSGAAAVTEEAKRQHHSTSSSSFRSVSLGGGTKEEEEWCGSPSDLVAELEGHAFDAWCSAALTIPCTEAEGLSSPVTDSEPLCLYTMVEPNGVSAPLPSSDVDAMPGMGNATSAPKEDRNGAGFGATMDGGDTCGAKEKEEGGGLDTRAVVTPVLLTGGDDTYLDLYHTYTARRGRGATPSPFPACQNEATPAASFSPHPHRRAHDQHVPPMADTEEAGRLWWHRDRRYTFEAGVVSIAPIRRVGEGSPLSAIQADSEQCRSSMSFASVYDIPLERVYAPIFHLSSPSMAASLPHPWREGASASIVVNTSVSTPYVLVGCYDESITLLDLRKLPSQPLGRVSSTFAAGRSRKVLPASSSCYIARKDNLGGGAWRVQRTLFPFVMEPTAAEVCDTYSPMGTPPASSPHMPSGCLHSTGWVSERNILVLPLMQFGAAMLSYDAFAAESAVFGEHLVPLPSPIVCGIDRLVETSSRAASSPSAAVEPLVYDTAVLGVRQHYTSPASGGIPYANDSFPSASNGHALSILLGTTSFYEKRVDMYEFGPLCASWSINDVLMKMK